MTETAWNQIAGHPDYFINEQGHILSTKWNKKRLLKGSIDKRKGYRHIALRDGNGGRTRWRIHRLVLETFIGPAPDGMQCRHLDGDKLNNRLDNLAWGTQSENERDKIRHGTQFWPDKRGEEHPQAKLRTVDIPEIRRMVRDGMTLAEVASKYPVRYQTISKIVNRERWAHIPG